MTARGRINPQCPHCGLRQPPSHQTSCSKRDDEEHPTPAARSNETDPTEEHESNG